MLDEVVPPHGLVLGGLKVQRGNLLLDNTTLIVTSFDQEDLVPGNGKPGGKRTTSGTGADNNVIIDISSVVGRRRNLRLRRASVSVSS